MGVFTFMPSGAGGENKETLFAFVDEIGDRGHSRKSSEYFAMSAVLFPASVQQKVKDCIANLKIKLGVDLKTPLHWRNHCRKHDTRKYITGEITKLEDITVIYIISDKKTVPEDHVKFYNIVAAFTLERVLKHTEKLNTKVCVRFGHVRGFNHSTTLDYFNKKDWHLCDYNRLSDQPKWISADSNSGIQLADLYAGILGAAMIPDRYGNYESTYLEKIKHQIRKSSNQMISGYGIKAISSDNDPKSFKWWPEGWT
jgi:hypothetical protein